MDYVRLGEWCGTLIWGGIPLWLAVAALRARKRSLRLANTSLALGFLALFLIESRLGLSPLRHSGWFEAAGCVRALLGCGGMVLGTLALIARRTDRGCAVGRAVTGIVISFAHMVVGGGMVLTAAKMERDVAAIREYAAHPSAVTPVSGPRLSVALPAAGWEEVPRQAREVARFLHPVAPRVTLRIHLAREQASRQEYDSYLEEEARMVQGTQGRRGAAREQRARTPGGNPCRYLWVRSGNERGEDCETVLASVWLPGKGIVTMLFDRVLAAQSDMMRTAEAEWLELEVKRILESAH